MSCGVAENGSLRGPLEQCSMQEPDFMISLSLMFLQTQGRCAVQAIWDQNGNLDSNQGEPPR